MRGKSTILVICGLDMAMREQLAVSDIHAVIIDDPHNLSADTLPRFRPEELLQAAMNPTPSRGPQPRTKYPRRR